MNKEYLMIAVMGAAGTLGAIGGTGFKPARRFILPFVFALCAALAGFSILPCIYMMIGFILSFCLPYGERTPWWIKAVVFSTFSAPTLFLGFTPWVIIAPVVIFGLFALSNWKHTSSLVPHKIWEFIAFTMPGICLAHLINMHG